MITKILFTLAVVGLIFALAGWKRGRSHSHSGRPEFSSSRSNPLFRRFVLILITIMLASAGTLLFSLWREGAEVLLVRVIDPASGRSREYQAYRGDIGERSFQTLDGKSIQLARSDRIELERTDEKP